VLTVSELTAQVKDLLEPRFARVLVRGEVTNFRGVNARGHLYFALKDDGATVDVKVWATTAQRLKFKLKDGLSVVIEGSLDVYAPQGRYSLIVQRIEPEGLGALALAFEQLKQKLSAEGLIGEGRTRPRRPLPSLPRRVGVVTSVSGAALKDFLKVLHRRHPRLAVLVADARVQGDGAAVDVRRALRWLGQQAVDVIVVTRGGGSVEDLWSFNEEPVVRAIWECPVPVVSAVGHEIDTTLADLVADVRAPTPSAAAELVAPALADLEAQLAVAHSRLVRAVERVVLHQRQALRAHAGALGDPRRALGQQRLALAEAAERASRLLRGQTRQRREALRTLTARLQAARPQAQLQARRATLRELRQRLDLAGHARLRGELGAFAALRQGVLQHSPKPRVLRERQRLVELERRLGAAGRGLLRARREAATALAGRLDLLSPLAVLGRGYAIALRRDGRALRRATDATRGEQLTLRLAEGALAVRVDGDPDRDG
jgi:exodeoxyribonuclease VII large subunit